MNKLWTINDFDYTLPPDLIAAQPAPLRDKARLLCWPDDGQEHTFADLADLLNPDDLLVLNDTRVIPARLKARRARLEGEGFVDIELLLHRPIDGPKKWEAFARPAKRLKPGQTIEFPQGVKAKIEERTEDRVIFSWPLEDDKAFNYIEETGEMPLPPYIPRQQGAYEEDKEDYQTVYARHRGSVAAPTAGLHFTNELLQKLEAKGVNVTYVTLHVGAGTFQPVRVENIHDHKMHTEWGSVESTVIKQIEQARERGSRVIPVGTTALRLLETAAKENGSSYEGETDIFITPGFDFKVADALITNFHLPKSTLLMLVSAFIGHEEMRVLYQNAIARRYRFYSYGDGCFLRRKQA